jgi:biopolymer transport protein ExbD
MKVRNANKGETKIDLQMTPMIDIVFQLLTFFVMTFKVVVPEGDFNIKMPLAAPSSGPPDESLALQVKLRITADPGTGALTGIKMNDSTISLANGADKAFGDLHNKLLNLVGTDSGPNSLASGTEVELDCDYNLRYEYVIRAITEVTGYVDRGRIVKLIEKIKFAPQRKPG